MPQAQTSRLANRQALQIGLQGPLVVRARELLEAPTDEVLDEHLDAARAGGDAAVTDDMRLSTDDWIRKRNRDLRERNLRK